MVREYWTGGDGDHRADFPPEVEVLSGAVRPVGDNPGMNKGIVRLVLFNVLVDGEAKADIILETEAANDCGFLMDPGWFRGDPGIEVGRNIGGNLDADAGSRSVKINVSN